MKAGTSVCLAALVLSGAVALATPASAQRWHRSWGGPVGAGVAGLAAGAVIGGAIASSQYGWGPGYTPGYYGYDPGYYAYEPGYAAAPDVTIIEGGAGGSVAYCMQRFKSYDPRSGTYLGYDGVRHPCP